MASSSPAITDREYTDGVLALAIAAATFLGYASSVLWDRMVAPHVFLRRELALERQVAELETEAETVCTTSKLYEHSRLLRKALRVRQELHTERRKRFSFECSLERVFSPLTIGAAFQPGFRQPVHRPTAVTAAARIAEQPAETSRVGGVGFAAANMADPSVDQGREAGLSALPVTPLRPWAIKAVNMLRYNAAAVIKYSLRYGTLIVFLCACGNRCTIVTAPPSFEEKLHQYTVQVVMPLLFNVAMFGPAAFGMQRLLVPSTAADSGVGRAVGADAAATGSASAARSMSHVSPALLDDRTTSSVADASFSEVKLRVCASNDLISWFLTCLLASYLVVRVVRTA